MTLQRLLAVLLLVALAAGGAWLWHATEWQETTRPLPPQGEAASNRWYTLQKLAAQAGTPLQVREQLQPLPPPGTTLVLLSMHWNLFPGRSQALRQWVQQGGHLVLSQQLLPDKDDKGDTGDANGLAWVPVREGFDKADARRLSALEDKEKGPPGQRAPVCRPYAEKRGMPYGTPRHYSVCSHAGTFLVPRAPVRWSVDGPAGPALLSVAVGRGQVTVLPVYSLLDNRRILAGDHALLVAAALPLQPGRPLWLVADEARTPLLTWLWQHAGVAVMLAALVIALALARRMPRFGPLRAAPPRARRAVTEQVQGTAAFLVAHGAGGTLLAAQRRALAELAERHIAGFAAFDDATKASAIADRTGLSAARLAEAWQGAGSTRPARLVAALQFLEAARRRLAAETGASPAPSPSNTALKEPADADQP